MTVIADLLVSSTDICGGRLCIRGTRITVHQIVAMYRSGATPEEIAGEYPQLELSHVYTALAHYHANRKEIDDALAEEVAESERLAQELMPRHSGAA